MAQAESALMFNMTFEDPPYGIARLAYFILVHYAPQWFTPRVRSTATEAGWSFGPLVRRSRVFFTVENASMMFD